MAFALQHRTQVQWRSPKRGRAGLRTGSTIVACTNDALMNSLASRTMKLKSESALPKLGQNHSEVVSRQLQALKENNTPRPDHGIELLYRYSNIDPWQRSRYFGRSFDLGQFERFRRIFHSPPYSILICHQDHTLLGSLQISENKWKERVEVEGVRPGESATFTFTMSQNVGGCFDGIWFCESLLCDDV